MLLYCWKCATIFFPKFLYLSLKKDKSIKNDFVRILYLSWTQSVVVTTFLWPQFVVASHKRWRDVLVPTQFPYCIGFFWWPQRHITSMIKIKFSRNHSLSIYLFFLMINIKNSNFFSCGLTLASRLNYIVLLKSSAGRIRDHLCHSSDCRHWSRCKVLSTHVIISHFSLITHLWIISNPYVLI